MKLPRLLLIWCLALALPGQAFAAALSSACLKMHGPGAVVAVVDGPAAPCHGGADASAASPKAHSCSACAACGLGLAWIPTLWQPPQFDMPEQWLPAPPVHVEPGLPAAHFKPPRNRPA